MSNNHPNRSRPYGASNPTPEAVKAAREAAGLTQTAAAELIYSTMRAWQDWESGARRMHPGLFELYRSKAGLIELPCPVSNTPEAMSRTAPPPLNREALAGKTPKFVKYVTELGLEIAILTPEDQDLNYCGHSLHPDTTGVGTPDIRSKSDFLPASHLTPLLLHMLSEAYCCGYMQSHTDCQQAVRKLVYENDNSRKPTPKIHEATDFTKT